MQNRIVGIIVVCISVLIGFIILSFNIALKKIVNESCSHGSDCPMWGNIDFHTNISIALMIIILLVGLYLIFFSREEKIITRIETKIKKVKEQVKPKQLTKENYKQVMSKMEEDDKKVFEKVLDSQGSIMQSELVEKTGFTKVKISRILDKLEGRALIERKRRGMTNVVVLKHI